jgi:hypothetical protein
MFDGRRADLVERVLIGRRRQPCPVPGTGRGRGRPVRGRNYLDGGTGLSPALKGQ